MDAFSRSSVRDTYAGLRADRNGLRALAKSVPHVDVVHFEIARPDSQRARKVIVRLRLLALGSNDRDLVLGVLGVIRGVSLDGERSIEFGDIDLFGVGAWVDEDDLRAGGVGERGDGCRYRGEVLPLADDESAFRCALAACG